MRKICEDTQLWVVHSHMILEGCNGNESLVVLHTHQCPFTHSKYRLSYQMNFRVLKDWILIKGTII